MFQTAALFKHLLLAENILFQGSMHKRLIDWDVKMPIVNTASTRHHQVTTLWTLWTPMILNICHIAYP